MLRRQDALTLRRTAMEAQIAAVRAEFAAQEAAALGLIEQVRSADDIQPQSVPVPSEPPGSAMDAHHAHPGTRTG